jgi:nucleoid-associated protein YgaU
MSVGFRIFLLIILGFGAVWMYEFRRNDLDALLGRAPRALSLAPRGPSGPQRPRSPVSPLSYESLVDRVIDPDESVTLWLRERSPLRLRGEGRHLRGGGGLEEGFEPSVVHADPGPSWDGRTDGFGGLEQEVGEWGGPDGPGVPDVPGVPGGPGGPGGVAPPAEGAEELPPPPAPEGGDGADGPGVPSGQGGEPATLAEEVLHDVGSGESLWSLAERYLGSGVRYPEIRDRNRDLLKGGELIREGMRLRIPVPPAGRPGAPDSPPDPGLSQDAGPSKKLKPPPGPVDRDVAPHSQEDGSETGRRGRPAPPAAERGLVLHRVEPNENLTTIAQAYYPGDARGWSRIFAGNRDQLESPDRIRHGMTLKIPPKDVP